MSEVGDTPRSLVTRDHFIIIHKINNMEPQEKIYLKPHLIIISKKTAAKSISTLLKIIVAVIVARTAMQIFKNLYKNRFRRLQYLSISLMVRQHHTITKIFMPTIIVAFNLILARTLKINN